MKTVRLLLVVLLLAVPSLPARAQWTEPTDVVVVGGTPAGVAAALCAARLGLHVTLIEKRPYLGAPLTSAMLNTFDMDRWGDEQSTVQGVFEEFYRVLGLTFNPMRARRLFLKKVRQDPLITLDLSTRFVRPVLNGRMLEGIIVRGGSPVPREREVPAWVVIDSTENGDVAAAAGVPFRLGRQGGGVDSAMQPASLLFLLKDIRWDRVFDYVESNDVPHQRGGIHDGYAWGYSTLIRKYHTADPRLRFLDLNIGLDGDGSAWINSLQIFGVDGTSRDSRMKAYEEASRAIPPFVKFLNAHAPGFRHARLVAIAPELYIRETRHIKGLRMLTTEDILTDHVFPDRIAVASYPIDIHPYKPGEKNPFAAGRHVYTIPLTSIVTAKIMNLFVASRCFSATYEAAGSARIIPTTVALGQAAGVAAAVCVKHGVSAHILALNKRLVKIVQRHLVAQGAQINP